MRDRPLRVVVVGAGAIGRVHARVACDDPDLEVIGIVAPSPDRAERLADDVTATGARRPVVSGALSSILAANDADLVAVCTPSGSHAELAHEAMTAGAHVVIEKPVATSLRRSRQLLSESEGPRAHGQVISVISQHRFDSGASFLHNAIAQGRLGRPTSAIGSVGWWRSQSYYDSGVWRGTWQLDGGGAVMNQAVHTVDLLLWLMGRPAEVSAYTRLLGHERIEVEDTAVAAIAFESGALAVLHATTAAYPGVGARLQFMGSRGSAIVDNDRLSYFHAASPWQEAPPMGWNATANQLDDLPEEVRGEQAYADPTVSPVGHARQYRDIVEAIRTHREPDVTIEDGVVVVAAVHAIYASAHLGRPVRFEDVISGAYDELQFSVPAHNP